MPPTYKEIREIEPNVVDLTVSDDHPEFSVRMPIFSLADTHETDYFELHYRPSPQAGSYLYELRISPALLVKMVQSKIMDAKRPLMTPDQTPCGFALGSPENVLAAMEKLNAFHQGKRFRELFARYGK